MAAQLMSARPTAGLLARPSLARSVRPRVCAVRAEKAEPVATVKAPVVGMLAAALLATSAMVPDVAEAAKSGGRMGGSGFAKAKSEAPARASTKTAATATATAPPVVNNTTVVVAPSPPMFGVPFFGGFGGFHPFGFGFGMPMGFGFGGFTFFFQIAITLMIFSFVLGLITSAQNKDEKY